MVRVDLCLRLGYCMGKKYYTFPGANSREIDMSKKQCPGRKFEELTRIMATLRGKNGCPWDKIQDEHSIAGYFLEEVYEAVDAVGRGDLAGLAEELGDVLMEVVFLARIFEERGAFSIGDSLDHIKRKMIRRHPHVFGTKSLRSASPVVDEWQRLKGLENRDRRVFEGLSATAPGLLAALQIGQRVSAFGFDWKSAVQAFQKVKEELAEVEKELEDGSRKDLAQEIGDLLFSVANVARLAGINPETALRGTNRKFVDRFRGVEAVLKKQGKSLGEARLEEMDEIWEEIKKKRKAAKKSRRQPTRKRAPGKKVNAGDG